MSPLKRLASQTAIYGVSSVLGRFLNYLLVPFLTYAFAPAEYGVVAEFYAYMGFLAVLLVFGLETGYFRFRSGGEWQPETVYGTVLRFLVLINALCFLAFLLASQPLAALLRHAEHPEYIVWCAAILAFDSIGALAFARLRAEERAGVFVAIKLSEIGVNVGLTILFIYVARQAQAVDPESLLGRLWDPTIGIGYVFIANLAASMLKLVLLAPWLAAGLGAFDPGLLKRLIRYSLPMVVIGLAGIVNEMLDRAALKYLLPYDESTNLAQLGIYSACYKLSILMSLFIQAFRYAGEPFFFSYAKRRDAGRTYALVLNWFVLGCVFLFLLVTLYIDVFQYFVGAAYRAGLDVVPVLLLANLLLGVYVNLSIWYKLSDRTLMGAGVSLIGSAITIGLLIWWVPVQGYMGAAWAHLVCYGTMVGLSYGLGQRYYPVPYDVGRVLGYIAFGVGLYRFNRWLLTQQDWPALGAGTVCLVLFLILVAWEAWRLKRAASA
ncbi:lipopolysaccharide biosynthesis protein [Thermochromatium tepidum]|uniref:Oligosaccharide flippase family protein n=1 Tax=Thermochromatium tepidum ATCC 43061 TaxID=316276 RepID=A0A6I6ED81_THETI|nr:oligosaccharide flippase family protein [Thermochromatium tepidum]QGU33306.1 oligosaccharide flippase family protein [Thermochromatium tepidum ATCC 43061]